MKLFVLYWFRWMASAVVMLPFMLLAEYIGLSLTANLMLAQTFGALVFFKIDKWIFKEK